MSINEFNTKTIIIYILEGLRISAAVKSCCRLQLQPSGIQMSRQRIEASRIHNAL